MLKRKPFVAIISNFKIPHDCRIGKEHPSFEFEREELAFDGEQKGILFFLDLPWKPAELAVIGDADSLFRKETRDDRRETVVIAVDRPVLELAVILLWRPELRRRAGKEVVVLIGDSCQPTAIVEMVIHIPRSMDEAVNRVVLRA